jgi:triosephosphate isomerase (TIM)
MRRLLIAGNWKMNMLNNEAVSLARQLKVKVLGVNRCDILVCPPNTALTSVSEVLGDSDISLGAQNIHDRRSGAFTGEISGEMARSAGCGWVLVGHSERRQFFGDDNAWVNRKLQAALEAGLHPILCVGETLPEREAGKLEEVLSSQINEGLKNFSSDMLASLALAYEPVWAIGTGVVATPDQAQEAHALIRRLVADLVDQDAAKRVRILYGGSVKPDNTTELLSRVDIDGALVGGASLKADVFSKIIHAAEVIVK